MSNQQKDEFDKGNFGIQNLLGEYGKILPRT
jgi:hypothetical protein